MTKDHTFTPAQAAVVSLDKSKLDAAYEAYWANSSGTYTSIEAAILSYLNATASQPPAAPVDWQEEAAKKDAELTVALGRIKELESRSSAATAEDVLNGIREALETRGYFHMANGRDIGRLLDEPQTPASTGDGE